MFRLLLLAASGFVLGAVLIASISKTPGASHDSTQTTYTDGIPTVHMNLDSFEQPSVTISKGLKLLLIDDGSYNHVLSNGTWQNGQPQPESVPGAPIVNNLDVNGNRVTIGPFTTAGTYHIYCSAHSGMMLTILVQ